MFSINTAAIAGQNTNLNVSGPYGLSKEALLKVLKAAKVSLSFTRPLMDVRMNFLPSLHSAQISNCRISAAIQSPGKAIQSLG